MLLFETEYACYQNNFIFQPACKDRYSTLEHTSLGGYQKVEHERKVFSMVPIHSQIVKTTY